MRGVTVKITPAMIGATQIDHCSIKFVLLPHSESLSTVLGYPFLLVLVCLAGASDVPKSAKLSLLSSQSANGAKVTALRTNRVGKFKNRLYSNANAEGRK